MGFLERRILTLGAVVRVAVSLAAAYQGGIIWLAVDVGKSKCERMP
jgi:hypothetical protein